MTDQTTAAPSGASAHREAAVELEDLLRQLDGDGTLDPNLFQVVLPGRDLTRRYRGHTRTLRLARTALRDHQRRVDATRSALAVQGPTDVSTADVEAIARLTQHIGDLDPSSKAIGIDWATAEVSPSALAAILRAGLASVVGDASPVSIDAEPAAEPAPEPARAEVSGPSVRASVQFSADGRRLTVSAEGIYERTQVDVVAPGTVLEAVGDRPVLEVGYPATPVEVLGDVEYSRGDPDPAYTVAESLAALAAHLESFASEPWRERYPYVCLMPAVNGSSFSRGREAPAPAWISASALAAILRAWSEPAAPAVPADGSPSMSSVYGGLVLGNPVHTAVARVLAGADGAVTDAGDLVRSVAVAALDEAADHLRSVLRQPRVTPLLVIDPDHSVWTEDSVVGMADRYRRTVADSAADELRILARLDSPRP